MPANGDACYFQLRCLTVPRRILTLASEVLSQVLYPALVLTLRGAFIPAWLCMEWVTSSMLTAELLCCTLENGELVQHEAMRQ